MPINSVDEFRARLKRGHPVYGFWATFAGSVVSSVGALAGAEYVVLDLQHGDGSEADVASMATAVMHRGAVPLVRTRSSSFADIGRVLDLGAHGVFVPNVRDATHAAEVIASAQYGPVGTRSIGRLFSDVDEPLIFLIIETAEAYKDLNKILRLKGLDGIYVGAHDLSLSMGLSDEPDKLFIADVVTDVVKRCRAAKVPVGVHVANGFAASQQVVAGSTIVIVGTDASLLEATIRQQLAVARSH